MWIYRTGTAQPKCSRSRGRGRGREVAGPPLAAETLARARVGGGAPPLPVALITFVLVLREGETSVRPAWGVGGGAGQDCLEGGAGNGNVGSPEGGVLSAFAQKRINSKRSNGLTAKRAHRGAAPRGREGVGEGRDKGTGVGEGVRTGRGEGQEEWKKWGEEKERK